MKQFISFSKTDTRSLQERAEDLQDENEHLQKENIDLRLVQIENEELKNILHYQEISNEKFIVAQVIGKPTESLEQVWTLNRGSGHGVEKGQAVIGGEGYLLGLIVETKSLTSTVMLLQDTNFRVAAMTLSGGKTSGIVQGSFGAGVTMNFIPRTEIITPGDIVVTSGIEEKIPKGLFIGTIKEITTESNDLFQSAVVAQPQPLSMIDFIGIIP